VSTRVAVLDYGSGNLHSVSRALARVGADVTVTADPAGVAAADATMIPGVGRFGACVRALRAAGLAEAVTALVAAGRPTFGVCVGMQVLYEGSDEDPDPGIGAIAGRVRRLPATVKVPHIGWNTVAWTGRRHPYTAGIPDGTSFYFVHSYAAAVDAAAVGVSEHGRTFAAAAATDAVFATQFHPEKSGEAGLQVYENFVKAVSAA
jgi:glutamine amidotransferase